MTAAHCLSSNETATVNLGMWANGNHFTEIITVKVANQFSHPGYDEDSVNNDIGEFRRVFWDGLREVLESFGLSLENFRHSLEIFGFFLGKFATFFGKS